VLFWGGRWCLGCHFGTAIFGAIFECSKMAKRHGPRDDLCGYPNRRYIFGVGALERADFFGGECIAERARGLRGYQRRSRRKHEPRAIFGL
jgi:hypothetical protein